MKPTRLTILADNDYYSQSSTTTATAAAASTTKPSRFTRFPSTLSRANKTGLGSSAALVTALTAALLTHHLDPKLFDITTEAGRSALHNLSQAAHCAAQGKVGSGFDVAAAVYGSCRYRRFSPSVLSTIPEPGCPGFASKLQAVVDGDGADASVPVWDTEIEADAVSLPPGVLLRMCDVDCGTQTVGMVKTVLGWKEQNPAAKELWDMLQARNEHLASALVKGDVEGISPALASVRELWREMGRASGAPLEPESQMELLDALGKLEGVYGGVVPGAGGFDALALLVRDDEDTAKRIGEFLAVWSREKNTRVRLLGVKGEMEGVRVESLKMFDGWI